MQTNTVTPDTNHPNRIASDDRAGLSSPKETHVPSLLAEFQRLLEVVLRLLEITPILSDGTQPTV